MGNRLTLNKVIHLQNIFITVRLFVGAQTTVHVRFVDGSQYTIIYITFCFSLLTDIELKLVVLFSYYPRAVAKPGVLPKGGVSVLACA